MTTDQSIPRYVVRNYCRKECNSVADENGGHFERHAGGPWMLAADVLPVLEELRRALTARDKELADAREHINAMDHDAGLLRKDAARYRWLRNTATTGDWQELGGLTAERAEEEIDRAIAAMEKANG